MPPSPVVRILRGWKDHAAISAPAPTGRPAVGRAGAAGGVLDDHDPAAVADLAQGVEVDGHAALVDRDDGLGALGDALG